MEYHKSSLDGSTGKPCTSDENAWCSSFVNWSLKESGYKGNETDWSASGWSWKASKNMTKLKKPAVGAIAVIKIGKWYHVTMVIGVSKSGNTIYGYGGNQGNSVKVSSYSKGGNTVFKGYYYPKGETPNYDVPILNYKKKSSSNESVN